MMLENEIKIIKTTIKIFVRSFFRHLQRVVFNCPQLSVIAFAFGRTKVLFYA
jgi:hypothetical protein